MSQNLVLFVKDKYNFNRELLKEFCNQFKLKTNFINSELDFFKKWNLQIFFQKLLNKDSLFVYVNYPLNENEDFILFKKILSNAIEKNENLFYVVRPNQYFQSSEANLVFFIQKQYVNFGKLIIFGGFERIKKYVFKIKNIIPFFNKIVNFIRPYVRKELSQDITNNSYFLPINLRIFNKLKFKEFIPEINVLKKDLVERIELFFPYPTTIHVVLANVCNLKCIHCPYHSPLYKPFHKSHFFDNKIFMDWEIYKKIVSYAAKNKIVLRFGQLEEPLLHKNLFDFIEYAKIQGVPYIHLTTNGTLMNREKADKLIKSGIDSIIFSIDAAEPETYRKIRGFDLKVLEENIRYFTQKAKKRGIRVAVAFIQQEPAIQEKEAFIRKWRNYGVNEIILYLYIEHDRETGKILTDRYYYNRPKRYICGSPWNQFMVFPDGEVTLCCKSMVEVGWRGVVSVGNLRRSSLDEIWIDKDYKGLSKAREELIINNFKEFEVCSDCVLWSSTTFFYEETEDYIKFYTETAETYIFKG